MEWLLCNSSKPLEDLQVPIKLNSHIKYTCVDVTSDWIWLGSNTGSLYVFNCNTLQHTHLVSGQNKPLNKPIEFVCAHPSETLCAVATKGCLYVAQFGGSKVSELIEATSFNNADVTTIHWSTEGSKLYAGLSDGRVTATSILSSRVLLCRSNTVFTLDSAIVQLDSSKSHILASSWSKTSLYDFESKSLVDIGQKVRNGAYGSVLATSSEPYVYCARPGQRLWKADFLGNVLFTYNFKHNLLESPQQHIYSTSGMKIESMTDTVVTSLPAFSKLYEIGDGILLSCSKNWIYVLSTVDGELPMRVQVNNDSPFLSCCVYSSSVYLLSEEGLISSITLYSLNEYVETLLQENRVPQAVEFCLKNHSYMINHPSLLSKIKESSNENVDPNITTEFNSVFQSTIDEYNDHIILSSPSADDLLAPSNDLPVSSNSVPIRRTDSNKSLSSLDSSLNSYSTRKSSFNSLSSFDQSGEVTDLDTAVRTSRKARVRAVARSFLRLDKSDGVAVHKDSPPCDDSGTVSSDHAASPGGLSVDLPNPAVFVDNVRLQVKDGLSKVSNKAIHLISSVKEKAAQSHVLDKLKPHESSDVGSVSGKSEDSTSQYGFFISDDDVAMNEEMPPSLVAYLEITESTYEKLYPNPQSNSQIPDTETRVQLLNNWCRKLCLLLSEYTNVHSTEPSSSSNSKTLLSFKKFRPWKMTNRQERICSELCDLCMRSHCCDSLSHYSITTPEDLTGPLISLAVDLESHSTKEPLLIQPQDSVFLSAFWFLTDHSKVLDYIQELSVADINRSRRLWQSFINCLIMSKTMAVDWREDLTSYTVSELKSKLIEDNSLADIVLYIFILGRLDRLEELLGASFSLWSHLPLLYLRFTLEELNYTPHFFSIYLYTILQFMHEADRASYLLTSFNSDSLLNYWISSLSCLYRDSLAGQECPCGKPQILVKTMEAVQTLPASMMSFDLPLLLEDTFPTNTAVQLTALLIGGESALMRRLMSPDRFTCPSQEDLLKYCLLSSGHSLITSLLSKRLLTLNDWRMLLNLSLTQDSADEDGNETNSCRCLWCDRVYIRGSSRPIRWQQLLDIMIKCITPTDTLDILSELPLEEKLVSTNVFTSCLIENETLLKQRQAADKFVSEIEGSFIWSQSKDEPICDPQLLHLVNKELDLLALSDNQGVSDERAELAAAIGALSSSTQSNSSLSQHWGARVGLNSRRLCDVCGEELMTDVKDSVLIISKHGKVCHQTCT